MGLDGPSRRITVTPAEQPSIQPVEPEPEREPETVPEREKVPA